MIWRDSQEKLKIDFEGKSRQNVKNKQTTFDLTTKKPKNELEGKTRQNVENKQTFDFTAKTEIEGKKLAIWPTYEMPLVF